MSTCTVSVETVAGLHPYGDLKALHHAFATGAPLYAEQGVRDCPAEAFAGLKTLGQSLRRTPRLAKLALAAGLRTGLFRNESRPVSDRDALIVATAYGSGQSSFSFMDSVLDDGPDLASPTAFSHSVTNMTAALISQYFSLTGPSLTVTDAQGGAFAAAFRAGWSSLRTGAADRVFLWVVEERQEMMQTIAKTAANIEPWMEGAVLFVMRRRHGRTHQGPSLSLASNPPTGFPCAASPEDCCGPGPLATAWEAALAYTHVSLSSVRTIHCRPLARSGGYFVVSKE